MRFSKRKCLVLKSQEVQHANVEMRKCFSRARVETARDCQDLNCCSGWGDVFRCVYETCCVAGRDFQQLAPRHIVHQRRQVSNPNRWVSTVRLSPPRRPGENTMRIKDCTLSETKIFMFKENENASSGKISLVLTYSPML